MTAESIADASLWGGSANPPCLLESFMQKVQAHADAIAVVDVEYELTYAELVNWIRQIAEMLTRQGVVPGDRVAITGPRSISIVAAMFAAVGLGATYVPLDSEYPTKRLVYMLDDSNPKVLLFTGDRPAFGTATIALRIPPWDNSRLVASPAWPLIRCEAGLPVYVIYTSGSTGLPKGVALPHSSIDNMAEWQQRHSVRSALRTAQFAPLNFDVWFQEVLGTLCGGGTLIVMPEPLRRDPIALLDWLAENRIERLFLPYVALNMLTVAASAEDSLDHLALLEINTAGEQMVCTPVIREFFNRVAGCRLNNHYGQSESAMVTVHTLDGPSDSWPALPPIGGPLPGCELLIDPLDQTDPAVGELLVTGLPLSVGYLNRPELNAERYVEIKPTARGHTRAFRTGDLVRVADECVHFISRLDREVKIRGFRVNPLEVDACLLDLPGVVEAVCVTVEISEGSKQLRAAVTMAEGSAAFDSGRMLRALAELLPEPSVPFSITLVRDLPRTPSGKIDRDQIAKMLMLPQGAS